MKTVRLLALFLVSAVALFAESAPKADAPPSSVLKRYDKNKDGKLDEQETAKWQADLVARREKAAAARQARLEKYDLDKDGKLSDEEKASAKLDMTKARMEDDLAKGKDKAGERIAREQAEKAKAESAEVAAGSPAAPAVAPETPPAASKPDDTPKMGDGMMMSE